MKHLTILLIFCGLLSLLSCQQDKKQAAYYFSKAETDTLVVDMISYLAALAPGSTPKNRFEARFRPFYSRMLPGFVLENFYQKPDGRCYFFIIRPVGSHPTFRRGVIGKCRLNAQNRLTDLEEVANTPHLTEELVEERGKFLFEMLAKNDQLDAYLPMSHYVEWPDSLLVYDKTTHQWVSTRKF
jgi:hypothetical protein